MTPESWNPVMYVPHSHLSLPAQFESDAMIKVPAQIMNVWQINEFFHQSGLYTLCGQIVCLRWVPRAKKKTLVLLWIPLTRKNALLLVASESKSVLKLKKGTAMFKEFFSLALRFHGVLSVVASGNQFDQLSGVSILRQQFPWDIFFLNVYSWLRHCLSRVKKKDVIIIQAVIVIFLVMLPFSLPVNLSLLRIQS